MAEIVPSVKTEERRDIDVINEIVLNGNKRKHLQCCLLPSNQRQKLEKREKLAGAKILSF